MRSSLTEKLGYFFMSLCLYSLKVFIIFAMVKE
nr:MAG TPA: hypothetical protein [Caudoviricetes sp.]